MHDVLVIGAGATGAPLAARLSADPNREVLLLEAGPDYPYGRGAPPELADASRMGAAVPDHSHSWHYVADLGGGRATSVTRGRTIGGSTATNGSYFIRGAREDFARWEAAGFDAWAPDTVRGFFAAMETDLDYGNEPGHGGDGPVGVCRSTARPAATRAFLRACAEAGYPAEPDKNAWAAPGYGPTPMNVTDGTRNHTGRAYLDPVRSRPNLTVLGNTVATRLLFEGTRCVGAETEQEGQYRVFRAREVILSAGVFNRPQLLMLSGIGPARHLAGLGIPVLLDAPGVGEGFSDHPGVKVKVRPVRRAHDPAGTSWTQACLHLASGQDGAEADLEIIMAAKPSSGLMPLPSQQARAVHGTGPAAWFRHWRARNDLSLAVSVMRTESRGRIRLASADPSTPPHVSFNYLEARTDKVRMRAAVRAAVGLATSTAFLDAGFRLLSPVPGVADDDATLDRWILAHLGTSVHAAGSARMGPATDPHAVVDQFGAVHGLEGLRIADTSIFPETTSRGPAATAVMAAELIAAHLLEQGAGPGAGPGAS